MACSCCFQTNIAAVIMINVDFPEKCSNEWVCCRKQKEDGKLRYTYNNKYMKVNGTLKAGYGVFMEYNNAITFYGLKLGLYKSFLFDKVIQNFPTYMIALA